jgi:hypothetical protein
MERLSRPASSRLVKQMKQKIGFLPLHLSTRLRSPASVE